MEIAEANARSRYGYGIAAARALPLLVVVATTTLVMRRLISLRRRRREFIARWESNPKGFIPETLVCFIMGLMIIIFNVVTVAIFVSWSLAESVQEEEEACGRQWYLCRLSKFATSQLVPWLAGPSKSSTLWVSPWDQICDVWPVFGRQLNLGMMSWCLYAATVGRRGRVAHLWSYALLSQLGWLPWAQVLFFFAVAYEPGTQPELSLAEERLIRDQEEERAIGSRGETTNKGPVCQLWSTIVSWFRNPKPTEWMPQPQIYWGICVINIATIAAVQEDAGQKMSLYLVIASRFLTVLPFFLPHLLPAWCGAVYAENDQNVAYHQLYRLLYINSMILDSRSQVLRTVSGVYFGVKSAITLPRPTAQERRTMPIWQKLTGPTYNRWDRLTEHISNAAKEPSSINSLKAADSHIHMYSVKLGQLVMQGWAVARLTDIGGMVVLASPRSPQRTVMTYILIYCNVVIHSDVLSSVFRLGGISAIVLGAEFWT